MIQLVGILNVTPDSFSDGGLFNGPDKALSQAKKLFSDGASFIDVGAESTRPNAEILSDEEEWHRLEQVLKELIKLYPGKVSLDSYHPATIRKAFAIGPVIINDVTGLNNPDMVDVVLELQPPKIIISQLPNMDLQEAHRLMPVSTAKEIVKDLLAKARLLESRGFPEDRIILDPGIGFGKTMELNKELLTFAELVDGYEVMIGYSRKRFLGDNRMELEPNIEAGKIAIAHKATYLRVHDVKGHANYFLHQTSKR